MFTPDLPISSSKEDRLGRESFSHNLGEALLSWSEEESLVIGIVGKWGSGKSSVIGLAKEYIKESKKSQNLTLIDFNPWVFSGQKKIWGYFFSEISKELEIKDESKEGDDKELANKLRLYAALLDFIPDENKLRKTVKNFLTYLAIAGIFFGFNILSYSSTIGIILLVIGVLSFISQFSKFILARLSNYFSLRAEVNKKTVEGLKNEIKKHLLKRKKKLLIIIDDIDRLTVEEIRQILKLVKVNSDFPNTIFLLAFDQKVIEKCLKKLPGIEGPEYLEKIIQVQFDIPLVKKETLAKILFEKLDKVLASLPKGGEKYFDTTYWANIYHSGFKDFFSTVRDVKRFINGLSFNISLMHKGESMEVNPTDFIAIEAIRIFRPSFYLFMRDRKELFTSTRDLAQSGRSSANDTRKQEIQEALGKSGKTEEEKKSLEDLIRRLFPQVDGVLRYGYSSHGSDWIPRWNKNLHVCSPQFFDAYFTLMPGGGDEELSQFEFDSIIETIDNEQELEKRIHEFNSVGKLRKVLERFQDFVQEEKGISEEQAKNIVQSLFNISDIIPDKGESIWDYGTFTDLTRVIYQLLKRNQKDNKGLNYRIMKDSIRDSKNIYGAVYFTALELPHGKDDKSYELIPQDKQEELKQITLDKLRNFVKESDIFDTPSPLFLLYRWKEWSSVEEVKKYLNAYIKSDNNLLKALNAFVGETKSQTMGDYGTKVIKEFSYKSFNIFFNSEEIEKRLINIKKEGKTSEENKDTIELFFKKESERTEG